MNDTQENDTLNINAEHTDSLYKKDIFPNNKNDVMYDDSSNIASLPFGPELQSIKEFYRNRDTRFYQEIIGKDFDKEPKYTMTYKLPKAEKVDYVSIDENETRHIPCQDAINYKIRLPNIGSQHVYYMSNSRYNVNDFGDDFQKKCTNHIPEYFGYLVLHDPVKNHMKVLLIFLEDYVDSFISRKFYIDSSYKLHVSQQSYTDGENGGAQQYDDWIYEIKISNTEIFKNKIR